MLTFFERIFAAGFLSAALLFGVLIAGNLIATPAAAAVAKGVSTAVETVAPGEVVATAALKGRSGKRVRGQASLERAEDGGYVLRLSDGFSLSRVPDPTIGFAKNGAYIDASEFTELQSFRGEQLYRVPAAIDPTDFDGLYIWCREFSIPLAFASFR